MVIRDYYRTLGLTLEASEQDIKKAYRKLAMHYHPDRNGGNSESEERLKEINEAYRILGDEKKEEAMTFNIVRIQKANCLMTWECMTTL